MVQLRAAVHVASPIPALSPGGSGPSGDWSPISCTLIYSDKEAVLVDTPITVQQTRLLLNWIEDTAPGRKLSFIYVTHGHGDHWFGIPLLLQRWPNAIPVATAGTVVHMKENTAPDFFNQHWQTRFPGQIFQPFVFAQPLGEDGQFVLEDKWTFQAIECGHTDTHSSTVLWVPDLRLVVAGDVVYGSCHQMLAYANSKHLRQEWIAAIEKVEALSPSNVIPGHKRAAEIDGVWHMTATKAYIEDFGALWASNPGSAQEVYDAMRELYPGRLNLTALKTSCLSTFKAMKEGKFQ